MNQSDFKTFAETFSAAWSFHKPINQTQIALAFELLKDYSINNVIGGLKAHCKDPDRGQFPPKPADIIAQIERRMPRRLQADEAFQLLPKDESETVVWTDEIAEAAAIASDEYDRVAKRMAFKAAYERIVERNKLAGKRPTWCISWGWCKDKREAVIHEAVQLGRITMSQVNQDMLPAPSVGIAGLLENHAEYDEEAAKENLKKLKQLVTG